MAFCRLPLNINYLFQSDDPVLALAHGYEVGEELVQPWDTDHNQRIEELVDAAEVISKMRGDGWEHAVLAIALTLQRLMTKSEWHRVPTRKVRAYLPTEIHKHVTDGDNQVIDDNNSDKAASESRPRATTTTSRPPT